MASARDTRYLAVISDQPNYVEGKSDYALNSAYVGVDPAELRSIINENCVYHLSPEELKSPRLWIVTLEFDIDEDLEDAAGDFYDDDYTRLTCMDEVVSNSYLYLGGLSDERLADYIEMLLEHMCQEGAIQGRTYRNVVSQPLLVWHVATWGGRFVKAS